MFGAGCFGTYEIYLNIFIIFLQILEIKSLGNEEEGISLRCVQVPVTIGIQGIVQHTTINSSLTDVPGPGLHKGISKNEDLFESLTENVSINIK